MIVLPAGKGQPPPAYCKSKEVALLSALTSVGGLLLVIALTATSRLDDLRGAIFLTFVFMLSVAPVLAAGLVHLGARAPAAAGTTWHAGLVLTKLVLLALVFALIFPALAKSRIWPTWMAPWPVVVLVLAGAAATSLRHAGGGSRWLEAAMRLDAWLIVSTAAAVFLFSPFEPDQTMPAGLFSYAANASGFGHWMLIGIAWTIFGIWLRHREGWAFPRSRKVLEVLAVVGASLFILSLYDDTHFVDFGHYTPLIGPALHATRGGVAMVDVYSCYGLLPWLVYRAAFALFDPTFGTAAVVLRLINLTYFAVVLLILISVTRRWLSALWFLIPAILVAVTSHNPGPDGMWNMNALPMTLGGRWLLPATMTLTLIVGRGRPWASWVELALIALAALSSVDIFAFTLAPWGYCLFVNSLRIRSVRHFLTRIALALVVVAGAHGAFFAIVYLLTGEVADYWPYFDTFGQFQPSEASIWSAAFVPYYALWFPIGGAYFVIVSVAIWRALRCQPGETLIERLLPVAAFGLGPLAYFFGRPQEGTLNIACTTFAIVAIALSQVVFLNVRRAGPAGLAMGGVFAVAFAFIAADGFEHFARPFDPSRGNSTVLRRCLEGGGCNPAEVLRNIDLALHTQPLDERTSVGYAVRVGGKRERIEEAIELLRRWAGDTPRVTMLTDSYPTTYADSDTSIGLASFMATGKSFAWGVSSPINDSSFAVIRKIVERAAHAPSGSPVIVSNSFLNGKWSALDTTVPEGRALSQQDLEQIAEEATLTGQKLLAAITYRQRDDLLPVNQAILATLAKRCAFRLLERGRQHSAFVTENCR